MPNVEFVHSSLLRITRITTKVRDLARLVQVGGVTVAAQELRRFIWSTNESVIMRRDRLNSPPIPEAKIPYNMRSITRCELAAIYEKIPPADAASRLQRDRGLRLMELTHASCWVAETLDGEPAAINFLLGPEDNEVLDKAYGGVFKRLEPDEMMGEGHYTLEPFRGLHLQSSMVSRMYAEACPPGVRFTYGHNAAGSKSFANARRIGFEPYLHQVERYRFFRLSVERRPAEEPLS